MKTLLNWIEIENLRVIVTRIQKKPPKSITNRIFISQGLALENQFNYVESNYVIFSANLESERITKIALKL